MNTKEVVTAFDKLLEELDAIIPEINKQGVQLMQEKKYDQARQIIAKAEAVIAFQVKVSALREEWLKMAVPPTKKQSVEQDLLNSNSKQKESKRTKEEDLKAPLLFTLVKMGGAGKVSDVLDNMEPLVEPILTEHDKQILDSVNELRWRNTTKWARADMVKEGLLDNDSPYGVWTITSYGRQWLSDKYDNYSVKEDELRFKRKISQTTTPINKLTLKPNSIALEQIIEVCEEFHNNGRSYNEAIKYVASNRGLKSVHTVADKCTRQLGLKTTKFKELIRDKEKLKGFLIQMFPNE